MRLQGKRVQKILATALGMAWLCAPVAAEAFCGFYVAKADTDLFNKASKVALVRDGDRTVITMANDYEGEPTEFAMVVPVPVVLEEGQVHVASSSLLDHLDAYTAPRLVEYRDHDPCGRLEMLMDSGMPQAMMKSRTAAESEAAELGVTIEESFTVGEYDILILSAKESDGLATWLTRNDYRIPKGAEAILSSYLKQDMKFFVAKVNLEEKDRLGVANLRPLQMAFESPRFGLPIRLGTVNARGDQDLFVYALTRTGRVETTNYRTQRIPSDAEIPPYVESEFADFYRDLFATSAEKEGGHGVFLEYAWDMGWCDPCAADPLSSAELRELGVFWLDTPRDRPVPMTRPQRRIMPPQAQNVFVTRLHVRYDAESFPEDLQFQTTGDRQNFQGRYVMRHPWDGTSTCEAADRYRAELRKRQDREAQTLSDLTGWKLADIRDRMRLTWDASNPDGSGKPVRPTDPEPWWRRLWPNG
ncbi:MAG: DUF2330 domain-containing protein [Myxococcota bacterium]